MFIGVGVGAYAAGVFHLLTHAFFKALLFLGAGSVIHVVEHAFHKAGIHDKDPQDIRNMGALYGKAKTTAITFIIAWIAISGIPPFSGFFSKDEILAGAYHSGHTGIFWLGLIGAALTAFYMSRLVFLTFFGKSNAPAAAVEHLHDSPKVMTIPLVILAFFAVVLGFIGVPEALGGSNWFGHFLASSVGEHAAAPHGIGEYILIGLSVLAGVGGILLAYFMYIKQKISPGKLAADYQPIYKTLLNKYYVDEIYDAVIVNPIKWVSEKVLWKGIDVRVIDGLINLGAFLTDLFGRILRLFQSGYVQTYAFFISIGLAFIIYYLFK